jgi:hypothetical protein
MRVQAGIAASQTRIGRRFVSDWRCIRKFCCARSGDCSVLDTADDANTVREKRLPMKLHQNRAGQWNVETMFATDCVLASCVDRGLFTQISFAGEREDCLGRISSALVGVNMNSDRLWTALLTRPTLNVRAAGADGNAINVANNATGVRVLSYSPGTGERRKTEDCDACKALQA